MSSLEAYAAKEQVILIRSSYLIYSDLKRFSSNRENRIQELLDFLEQETQATRIHLEVCACTSYEKKSSPREDCSAFWSLEVFFSGARRMNAIKSSMNSGF